MYFNPDFELNNYSDKNKNIKIRMNSSNFLLTPDTKSIFFLNYVVNYNFQNLQLVIT